VAGAFWSERTYRIAVVIATVIILCLWPLIRFWQGIY
jgi:hypothetical protein